MSILAAILASSVGPGQEQFTTPGTTTWQVPAGVFAVSAVTVGGGGQGTGGGLSYANAISVIPGETLTVVVGASSGANPLSALKRGATVLLSATTTGDQGNGGTGGPNGTRGGGGAGGYAGNGGTGSTTGSGTAPDVNSGGGGGGAIDNDGGGVGLQGRTATFDPGSRGSPKCGGGIGEGSEGGPGGVRVMWGGGRSYPDNAADI